MSNYRHGSIWIINFEPNFKTEIGKTRPGLIISDSEFNSKRSKLTVLPFSTNLKKGGARIQVTATEQNGLDRDSIIIAIEPATFDKGRLKKYLGNLEPKLLIEVKKKLCIYLNLIID